LDDRPTYRVFEVWTEVKEHGKLKSGVWYFGMTKGTEKKPPEPTSTFICSPLYIDAVSRDSSRTDDYGRLLRFKNTEGKEIKWSMPMEMLVDTNLTDLCKALVKQGLEIDPHNRRLLASYIWSVHPDRKLICVNRVGWADDKTQAFVLPDKAYGFGSGLYTFQSRSSHHAEYECAGTLKGWQDGVAARAIDNPVLMTSLSVGFSGPILLLVGALGSGGIHWSGPSSTGKSTLLSGAASISGSPTNGKHVRSWNTTANGLEGIAELFNDNTLVMDEINQADPRDVNKIVYAIGNEVGKTRADRTGAARDAAAWRVSFLSSGEKSIATVLDSIGQRANAGQQVRVLDMPVERKFGVYDVPYGFKSGAELSNAIVAAAKANYGHSGRAFLDKLTKDDRAKVRQRYTEYCDTPDFSPEGASGQVKGVGARFALFALAGELALDYGIVPWREGTAADAAAEMFRVWRKNRPSGNQEPHQILDAVRCFIERHGSARFGDDDQVTIGKVVYERAGWKDGDEYWFHGDGMREALKGFDFNRALEVLETHEVLKTKPATDKDRKKRWTQVRRIPGEKRVYVIDATKLDSL
jgi:putative DNA primase/helicase